MLPNQNPEQIARDQIDKQLTTCGWIIQGIKQVNLHVGIGVAVKEYRTDVGPADYVLFVDAKPCGIIEAKREEEGPKLNEYKDQTEGYALAKLKHLNNEPLPYVFISTGEVTRFMDFTNPKPRARDVNSFQQPETLRNWRKKDKSLMRPKFITSYLASLNGIKKLTKNAKHAVNQTSLPMWQW
ncbi:MAG: type I restriction endonuclease [Lentimicrobiaceae bacterium]